MLCVRQCTKKAALGGSDPQMKFVYSKSASVFGPSRIFHLAQGNIFLMWLPALSCPRGLDSTLHPPPPPHTEQQRAAEVAANAKQKGHQELPVEWT